MKKTEYVANSLYSLRNLTCIITHNVILSPLESFNIISENYLSQNLRV